MAKPLKLIVDFLSYEGTLTNNPADATQIKKKVEESDVTEVSRFQSVISDGTTDQAIALPDAATDYLLIFTDREVSIKLNGSSDALVLRPRANGTKTPVFVMRGTISALSISNASGGDANVDIISVNI